MNRRELSVAISERTSGSVKATEAMLEAFMSIVTEKLCDGEQVKLVGFGTFESRTRAERRGKNPRTGIEITIPAANVPAFKPGKALREAIK